MDFRNCACLGTLLRERQSPRTFFLQNPTWYRIGTSCKILASSNSEISGQIGKIIRICIRQNFFPFYFILEIITSCHLTFGDTFDNLWKSWRTYAQWRLLYKITIQSDSFFFNWRVVLTICFEIFVVFLCLSWRLCLIIGDRFKDCLAQQQLVLTSMYLVSFALWNYNTIRYTSLEEIFFLIGVLF